MAGRPPKNGIDYAGWDVNIFDSDPKIDALMDAQGCIGFTIYFYLCQRAYGSNGYFYPWCSSDELIYATVARKVGGGVGATSVRETVNLCLRVGLFDKELCDRERILTSRGIQKRYKQIAMSRTNKSVISEYWLLSDEESEGLVKVGLSRDEKRIMTPHNSIMTHDNSRIKESKGKESIPKDISPLPPEGDERFDAFWSVYPRRVGRKKALERWRKIKPSEMLFKKILAAVEAAKLTEQWQKNNGQYIPHPTSWLTQERWDDENFAPEVADVKPKLTPVIMTDENGEEFTRWVEGDDDA